MVTIVLWRLTKFSINLHTFWKILFASAIMALLIWPLQEKPLWVPLLAGIVIYSIGVLGLKIVQPKALLSLLRAKA